MSRGPLEICCLRVKTERGDGSQITTVVARGTTGDGQGETERRARETETETVPDRDEGRES